MIIIIIIVHVNCDYLVDTSKTLDYVLHLGKLKLKNESKFVSD